MLSPGVNVAAPYSKASDIFTALSSIDLPTFPAPYLPSVNQGESKYHGDEFQHNQWGSNEATSYL